MRLQRSQEDLAQVWIFNQMKSGKPGKNSVERADVEGRFQKFFSLARNQIFPKKLENRSALKTFFEEFSQMALVLSNAVDLFLQVI